VLSIADSGPIERVYNCEVEGDLTYFVGGEKWGWSVWVHNACVYQSVDTTSGTVRYVGIADRGITKTLNQRLKAAKARTGFAATPIPGTIGMTTHQVESIEQALIKHHGRVGRDPGGVLTNKYRGTHLSAANITYGESLLKSIHYPGF